MEVFQNLINRGLKRVLMFISDDFSGISEAINTLFPLSDIQKQENIFIPLILLNQYTQVSRK